jgi:hypothetical protein
MAWKMKDRKKKKLEWKSQKYFQAIIHEQWQRAL